LEEAVRGQPEHPEQSGRFLERDTQNVTAATAAQRLEAEYSHRAWRAEEGDLQRDLTTSPPRQPSV
jgi:hypothetical protein